MIKPTEILENEHRIIAKVVGAAPILADRLETGQTVDMKMLQEIVGFMHTFADKCHQGKEEEMLFPALVHKGVPMQGCPVGVLTAEHTKGRILVKELSESVAAFQGGDSRAKEAIIKTLRGIAALYPNHIWKEDYLLFPLTNKVLSSEEQQNLFQRFEQVEERIGHDTHQHYEQFAEGLSESTQN